MKVPDFSTLAFIDVETTGTSPFSDRVIEVGIIRVENGIITRRIKTLINPGGFIPEEILGFTGITPQEIESAPSFYEMADEIEEALSGALFVAHNARFDYAFIKNEFRILGQSFQSQTLCTVKLARKLYPGLNRYNLDSIIEHFDFPCENRHRAFDDAFVLYLLWEKIQQDIASTVLDEALSRLFEKPNIPNQISSKDIDDLPHGPGVYLFYGAQDICLYIGKSINIQKRVVSHFLPSSQSLSDLKIASEITRIEYQKTAGELGALLREAQLIKKIQPVHNRKLRRTQQMLAAYIDDSGLYPTVQNCLTHMLPTDRIANVIGVFRSRKQMNDRLHELARDFSLCPKLLGLEKCQKGCFAMQLGHCAGACIGEENPLVYKIRFAQAIANMKIPPWPFSGIAILKEKIDEHEIAHAVYNWCYLGEYGDNGDIENEFDLSETQFDWDMYKILRKFILKPSSGLNITTIPIAQTSV